MGQVIAQVIKVGPDPVGPDRLAGGLGIGQRLVPGSDP